MKGSGAKKWYDERKRRQEKQLEDLGLSPNEVHRIESAEIAQAKYEKAKKKPAPMGWNVFNQKTLHKAYEKRAELVHMDHSSAFVAKSTWPDGLKGEHSSFVSGIFYNEATFRAHF